MKKIYYLLLTFTVLLVSCQDIVTYEDKLNVEEVSTGAPEITKIAPVTDREGNITEGDIAQVILIQGKNLTPVKELSINGIKVAPNLIYAKVNEISTLIPRKLPTEETHKIILTTDWGTVEYDFNVEIPQLRIDGISYEYASAGDTVSILGDFFDVYEVTKETAEITFGGKEVEIIKAREDELRFIVPEDYDNVTKTPIVLTAPLIEPITLYMRNPGYSVYEEPVSYIGDFAAWSWNVSPSWVSYSITDPDIINNPQDYYFKFEMSTLLPINVVGLHFYVDTNKNILYSWNSMLEDNNGVEVNTKGKWITKSFSLTMFEGYEGLSQDCSFATLFSPSGAIKANITMKNFRIAKK